MSADDWKVIADGFGAIGSPTVGIAGPNGGGHYVYGARATAEAGFHALRCDTAGTAPAARGANVSAAMLRARGAPSAAVFASAGGGVVGALDPPLMAAAAAAYLLGVGFDGRVRLAKGLLGGGLGGAAVLAQGEVVYPLGAWVHLRLDVIANANGDVILNAYQSDLGARPVTAPAWTPIPGIGTTTPHFVDDRVQINTGSPALKAGYSGFAFYFSSAADVAAIDHVTIERQD
jgi:hypothetical protein